ncbi:MAG TPA: electron transfer flavoprotein subunit beta/FixA family protein [Saprospiraceae bacterium]|nr:electron transfer flavoprotein subunit beta/FixA family protein [Saprospiraceae bacterium]HQW55791.1 electron transfer flavoprotein subunit beta/FixA family protein [Saprospiraceae bacterium]
MKILVGISKTPDTTARISFKNDNTEFQTDGVQFILNPYDEWYALVRALELTEQNGGSVTVIHVGPAENEAIIRKALAIGATDAIRINKEPEDAMDVATQMAAHASGYDLILTGKETISYNDSAVGSILAEMLGLPFVSYATKLDVTGTEATVTREIEGGSETLTCPLPAVMSAAKGLAEQRIPNMKGIMMSKSKPLQVMEPVAYTATTLIDHFELPPAKQSVRLFSPDQVEELIIALHDEAKAI